MQFLMCKLEGLSLDPRDPLKKLGATVPSVILVLGRQRQEDLYSSFSSLLVFVELQTQ